MRYSTGGSRSHPMMLLGSVVAVVVMQLALVGLVGCGATTSSAPRGALGDEKPTHVPTIGTPTPTVTPYLATPASIAGWPTYTDSAYHFTTVIPPGWRVGTAVKTDPGWGNCEYEVVYFPPGDTRAMEPSVTVGMHEFMLIAVTLNCPTPSASDNQYLTAIGSVSISGSTTTLYANDTDEEVGRVVYTRFGGHPYTFVLLGMSNQHTPITADVPLYLGMLSGFVYHR